MTFGSSPRSEMRCRAKSGVIVDVSVTASKIREPDGRVTAMCAIIRDIREQKRSEARLRESEERFRVSFANASIGLAMNDPDGRFLYVNPAFCATIGYTLEELRLRTFPDLIHPEDRAADMALVEKMLAGDIPDFVVENRQVRKGGDSIWVRKSVSLVRGADHAPRWIIALVEDVTARVEAEEAVREADRNKDVFLATLAHELRNPLAPIRSGLEMLRRDGGDATKAAQRARHHGAPGRSSGAAGGRPHGSVPRQPGADRAAKGTRRPRADRQRRAGGHSAARSPGSSTG